MQREQPNIYKKRILLILSQQIFKIESIQIRNHKNPGLIQKLKVPKWVCLSSLANFRSGQPFFGYLAPPGAKCIEKRFKKNKKSAFWCLFYRDQAQLSSRDQVGCQRGLPDCLHGENPGAVARQSKPSSWLSPSNRGGCASSQLDHGLKVQLFQSRNHQNDLFLTQNHQNPGLSQKLKVPKWVCRSTLANFCNEPTLFAIFGPARGQIFGKKAEKIQKIVGFLPFLSQNQENEGFNILDSGIPKFSRRRPTQPSRPVAFEQETAFHTPINPIFGPARGQIY